MKLFKALWKFGRILRRRRKLKTKLQNDISLIEAFQFEGETYYMHTDPLSICTGRGLAAMVHYEELLMRCDIEYLKAHTKAMDKVLNSNKISVPHIVQLNENLKQRIDFLAAIPDTVYKFASIVFFTDAESPVKYDEAYNQKKIEKWKQAPDMYSFFLRTPLQQLIPFLALPENETDLYLKAQAKIEKSTRTLAQVLSSKKE